MSPRPVIRFVRRPSVLTTIVLLALAGLAWLALASASRPAAAPAADTPQAAMPGMPNMSEESMRLANQKWFAAHPPHAFHTTDVPVDTFTTAAITFDADHNTATAIDTVTILVGQTVAFQYGAGVGHTCISGTGPTDPAMGLVFNMPLAATTDDFTFTFTSPGVVPFFCNLHFGLGMKGCVIVNAPVGVGGVPAPRAGFVAPPWPNPSRGGVNVRFALSQPGRARLEALDLEGRRVTTVLDRTLGAGQSTAIWDGRGATGMRVPAGVYFLRLEIPGLTQTRRVAIER